jgi:hypothetical protein
MGTAGTQLQPTTQAEVCISLQCLLGWLVGLVAAAAVAGQLLSCACGQIGTARGLACVL